MRSLVAMVAFGVCFSAIANVDMHSEKELLDKGARLEESVLNQIPCVNQQVKNYLEQFSQKNFDILHKNDFKFDKVNILAK